MKKYISLLTVAFFIAGIAKSQDFVAPVCSCTSPSNSTCVSTCTFSDCCICWNPNTQSGACGCYWGVATCKNQNNNSSSSMRASDFGEVHPDAKIKFSFEKFNYLFEFFKSKGINPVLMENIFTNVKSGYALTGQKVSIQNKDFSKILSEYSKLIDSLNASQKEELNVFIKSIK